MGILLFLFIVVPAVELGLLIKLGGMIGVLATIAIIVITGTLGATLARWQGLGVLGKMQSEMARGGIPAESMVDGLIILVASAFLLTPGFLTDIVGFSCLIPGFRTVLKNFARKRLEKAVKNGNVNVFTQFGGLGNRPNPRSDSDTSGNIEM
jgi:UPF0716 protein FxsA